MAENEKKTSGSKKVQLVDPIYQKFTKSVIRALGSTEFYEYFMDALAHSDNEIQFSNRNVEKTIDISWVAAIERGVEAFQSIITAPRHMIKEEELIVNVANAKKGGADVVQHLAQHASLVEKFDERTGEVRPSRVMQKYREDSVGQYENRLVYTALENAYQFVKIRHDALFSVMSNEYGAKLRVRSDMESAIESVHVETMVHIKSTEGVFETETKNQDVYGRISRLYRVLTYCLNTPYAQELAKLPRVKGAITKTNVLKRNPQYKKIMELFDFLHSYEDVGYTINVVEQSTRVSEEFQRDIFHNVLFNYLALKSYLESDKERQLPKPMKEKKRTLKPKFIKEIIEELTEDYDLPDVEIRKVLIEELTKTQLMQEEAAERRRLVEEQAQRKKEEAERIRQEKAAERERIRQEKEAEKERIRMEKEAEAERQRRERMQRELEDRRRSKLFKKELAYFAENLLNQQQAREEALAKEAEEKAKQDFADAARLLEEAEQRKQEAAERAARRRQEEKERAKREKELTAERERQAKEAEKERIRQEKEAEAERIRLEKLAEEERIRREEEERQAAEQARLLAEAQEKVQPYQQELVIFLGDLEAQLALRVQQEEERRAEEEQWQAERQRRRAEREGKRIN